MTRGSSGFWGRVPEINRSAEALTVFAVGDLDREACPGRVVAERLPGRNRRMIVRLAVREIESWLLADRESMGELLKVLPRKLPAEPDQLADPKAELVRLARYSKSKEIRACLVPRPGSSAVVGVEYNLTLLSYVERLWRPREGAKVSPSLRRAIDALVRAR